MKGIAHGLFFFPNKKRGGRGGMAPDTFYREKHRAQSVSEGKKITEGRFYCTRELFNLKKGTFIGS